MIYLRIQRSILANEYLWLWKKKLRFGDRYDGNFDGFNEDEIVYSSQSSSNR
jgi:hypothetical protein